MKPEITNRWIRLRVCAWFVASTCALPLALAQNGSLSGSQGGSDQSGGSTRAVRVRGGAYLEAACLSPADCNDGLPCTADICVEGACANLPIPGCIPCELSYTCPPVEVVFIMDTSGSMRDEAAVLCSQVFTLSEELAAIGISASVASMGITELPGGPFDCLFDTVVGFFGPTVPGEILTCPFPGGSAPYESWGPATAIVAQSFPWQQGSTRIIIPMSDEGPCNGSRPEGCNDPGDDRDSIDNAIAVALANNCIVSPIAGTSSDECVINLGSAIAKATGGKLHQLKNPKSDFKTSLLDIILQTCVADAQCDDQQVCTDSDTCVDGRCQGSPVGGCQVCVDDFDCNDQSVCTADSCVDGFCEWDPLYAPEVCCNPANGLLTPIDDGNPCTVDLCNPVTGKVTHQPGPTGVPCDDLEACTVDDVCSPTGTCSGTPIYTLPCQTDEDCFGNTCSLDKMMCVCNEVPELCLNEVAGFLPAEGCYNVGEDIFINVEVGNNASLIAGGQFLIQYDPQALQFVDVIPGAHADPESPFGTELSRTVNEEEGYVFYAVGVVLGGPMTYGPSIMAVLHFQALTACATTEVCFGGENPMNTRLTTSSGHQLAFVPCCTGELMVNGPPPDLTCPQDITANAEAGTLSKLVTWPAVGATSSCPLEQVQVDCSGTHDKGYNVDNLVSVGGRAPVGKSTFTCLATDECGSESTCTWKVDVRNLNTLEVDLELSPSMAPGPVRRCIEFAFFSSCFEPPVVVQKTIEFGQPLNLPGRADRVSVGIPPGQYFCVTARDVKHSLRSTATLSIVGSNYYARFRGDPATGGNWLLGGDLDGNGVIDSIDQALVMASYQQAIDPQAPCGTAGFHPDINGDGLVNDADLLIIQRNLLKTDAISCCPANTASAVEPGRTQISLQELAEMGYGDLSAADINGDGMVTPTDMTRLLRSAQSGTKTMRPRPSE